MLNEIKAGASRPVIGGALPLAWRVIEDLYARIDFQKESLDGLRDDHREIYLQCDELRRQLETAINVGEMNARSGAAWAAEARFGEIAIRACEAALARAQGAVNAVYAGIVNRSMTSDEAAAILAEVAQAPAKVASDETNSITFGADVQKDGIAADLPPGFIRVGEMLPPGTYDGKLHPGGFFEVDPASISIDVFRSIYGLDRPNAATPEPETADTTLTEEESFILEAADQHGFISHNDEDTIFSASDRQIISLVKAAREQGRQDVLSRQSKLFEDFLEGLKSAGPIVG